ncbi:hypothetical protein [Acinetobacter seifertii]|uniref:hypothetical protein n=1 Tax=Acinetobacter seifertii TaxID=1530123 RepID=UPI00190699FC|nr:hypothetical protein [Acinetobacter seifertii]MBJ9425190.1 hypothetical protein [Acinetobacter seifertii]
MFLVIFGFKGIKLSKHHEFNLGNSPTFWKFSFLFFEVLYLRKENERGLFNLFSKYAWSEHDLDWHPHVRIASAKGYKRALAEYRTQKDHEIERLKKHLNKMTEERNTLQGENITLRSTVKGLHLVLNEPEMRETDKSVPAAILEAMRFK